MHEVVGQIDAGKSGFQRLQIQRIGGDQFYALPAVIPGVSVITRRANRAPASFAADGGTPP